MFADDNDIFQLNDESIYEYKTSYEDIIELKYLGLIFTDNNNNEYFIFLNEDTGKIDLMHDLGGYYDNSMIYQRFSHMLSDEFEDIEHLVEESYNNNVYSLMYTKGNEIFKPVSTFEFSNIARSMYLNNRDIEYDISLLKRTAGSGESDILNLTLKIFPKNEYIETNIITRADGIGKKKGKKKRKKSKKRNKK